MNDVAVPASALEVQVEALLKLVQADCEQRCTHLRASAEAEAREILRVARKQALADLRKAIALERTRLAQGIRQAEARAEMEARSLAQREVRATLGIMWSEIRAALETRWRNAAHRNSWIESALAQAGALLERSAWRIEHGADLAAGERETLAALAARYGAASSECVALAVACAGLRIHAAGVCVDATIEGLLARREDVESEFLARYLGAEERT